MLRYVVWNVGSRHAVQCGMLQGRLAQRSKIQLVGLFVTTDVLQRETYGVSSETNQAHDEVKQRVAPRVRRRMLRHVCQRTLIRLGGGIRHWVGLNARQHK